MNLWPLALCLMLLLRPALCSLPAPVNLSVDSLNLHHVLRWDPGPGTPPGTLYKVYKRLEGKKYKWKYLNSTRETSFVLKLNNYKTYYLTVQLDNQMPPEPLKVRFTPYKDTEIGPPEVSLAGCGKCIRVNISLPKNVQTLYKPEFIFSCRKENEAEFNICSNKTSFTIKHLEKGVKYCVKVDIKIRGSLYTKPSTWECIYTSPVETRRDGAVLGAVSALLVVVASVLMTSMLCLYYTGFLCKLQAALPRALITALIRGYTLTPEKTRVDQISISIKREKQRVHNNPTSHHASSEDGEEEEDEEQEEDNYFDRNAELSSGESSCKNSNNMSGDSKAAVSRESPAEVEGPAADFEVGFIHEDLDQDKGKAEVETSSFMPEEDQTEAQGHATGEEEEMNETMEVCESSENVNLFSVTLAALAVSEEEEQDTTESLSSCDPECLLSTVSKLTLNKTDSQTGSEDQTPVESVHPTHKDFTETECEGTQEEEEEDDDDSSGYMAHI